MKSKPLRGLYAITDNTLVSGDRLTDAVSAAIRGGAKLIQYRDKSRDKLRRHTEASSLLAICREQSVPLLINDDVELAHAIGADGVHLGRHDMPVGHARERLGPDAIIGLSCYGDILTPGLEIADYAAFGRVFPSSTKPEAPGISLEVIQQAHRNLDIPVVAIGGITGENAASVVSAGADMIAVVGGLFSTDDIEASARKLSSLY